MSKHDFSYQIDPNAAAQINSQVFAIGDSLEVNFSINLNPNNKMYKGLITRDIWYMDYKIYSSLEAKTWSAFDTLWLRSKTFGNNSNEKFFTFKIPKSIATATSSIMMISFMENQIGETQYVDVPLRYLDVDLSCNFKLLYKNSKQFLKKFATINDTLKIVSTNNFNTFKIQYFKYNFPPAYPPMFVNAPSDVNLVLEPDSVISINKETFFILSRRGVYKIFSDQSPNKTIVFTVFDENYPKLVKTKELVDPLIYISTDEERKIMKQPDNQKLKLDEYWLNITKDKNRARIFIKEFYQRVKYANELFSNHKDGWKTDQGMIFCVLGNPNEVVKLDNRQIWFYLSKTNETESVFEFQKKTSAFGNTIFELKTATEYVNPWFSAVDKWRKGLIDKKD